MTYHWIVGGPTCAKGVCHEEDYLGAARETESEQCILHNLIGESIATDEP